MSDGYGGQGQLAIAPSVSGSDMLVINGGSSQRYRALAVDTLAAYITEQYGDDWFSQYFAPNATGFTLALGPIVPPTTSPNPWTQNFWILVTPAAGYAAGTVTLPPNTYLKDKQVVRMFFTQAVTTLTFALNGAAVGYGLPTTIAANGFFELQYDLQTNGWYRVV